MEDIDIYLIIILIIVVYVHKRETNVSIFSLNSIYNKISSPSHVTTALCKKIFVFALCGKFSKFYLLRGDQEGLIRSMVAHEKMLVTYTFVSKMILHNYILYKGQSRYVGIFYTIL